MIAVRGYDGHRVAIAPGSEGQTCRRCARSGGRRGAAWDDGAAAAAEWAAVRRSALVDPMRARAFDGVAALIVSPGIPHLYPAPHPATSGLGCRRGGRQRYRPVLPVVRHTGMGQFRDRTPQVVGITGSNGKSTTTALIHILASARSSVPRSAAISGVLSLAPAHDGIGRGARASRFYQTDLARALQPDIAVHQPFPDHLDRYGGIGGYFAAKRAGLLQGGPERAIIGVDETEGRYLADQMARGPGRPLIAVSGTKLERAGLVDLLPAGFLRRIPVAGRRSSIDLRGVPTPAGANNH